MLFCPTSKVKLLNPIILSKVSNIVLMPPSSKNHLADSAPPLH
jgi:hypothetical protein